MDVITDQTPEDLENFLLRQGLRRTQAHPRMKALGGYLFRQRITCWSECESEPFSRFFRIPRLSLRTRQSSRDGTEKFLFALEDGNLIETVLIPDVGRKKGKRTLCISTQVGCAMGCRFCLTGKSGLMRNLKTWEIVEQVREVSRQTYLPLTHLVFMGMGEPLHNFDALLRAIRILTSPRGAGFPPTRLTVSTSGLLPELKRLCDETDVLLALTLSAPNDRIRSQIMPINRKYGIHAIQSLFRSLSPKNLRRVFVEYVLLQGVNDQPIHAFELAQWLREFPCKVNLIPFNELSDFPFRRPTEDTIRTFSRILRQARLQVSTRTQRGRDILAACGQLSSQSPL